MKKLLMLSALSTIVLAGCLRNDSQDWQNRSWQLVSIDGKPFSTSEDVDASIQFSEDTYSFQAPCNSGFGGYKAGRNGKLTMGPSGVTLIACRPHIDKKEREFMVAIDGIERMQHDGNQLILFNKSGAELLFEAQN